MGLIMSLSTRKNYGHSELHMDRHLAPDSLASANGPTNWNEALDIISFGTPEQVCGLSCVDIFISSVGKIVIHQTKIFDFLTC